MGSLTFGNIADKKRAVLSGFGVTEQVKKEAADDVIMKSNVRATNVKTKSGKIVPRKAYTNSKTKKATLTNGKLFEEAKAKFPKNYKITKNGENNWIQISTPIGITGNLEVENGKILASINTEADTSFYNIAEAITFLKSEFSRERKKNGEKNSNVKVGDKIVFTGNRSKIKREMGGQRHQIDSISSKEAVIIKKNEDGTVNVKISDDQIENDVPVKIFTIK